MPKKPKQSALDDLKTAQSIAEMEDDDRVKLYREQEKKILQLGEKLKLEKGKRKNAERELEEAEGQLALFQATSDQVEDAGIERIRSAGKSSSTPIICLNDWHVEEQIDPNVINGMNEYNPDIAKERISRALTKAIEFVERWRHMTKIDDIVIWFGGDLINGFIHEEFVESNFMSPTEALLWVQDQAYSAIRMIQRELKPKTITVLCNWGNHGRTTRKPRTETAYANSYEWLGYQNLARSFSDDSTVTFKIAKGYHLYAEIEGWRVRFHHGDGFNYRDGVGGITIPVNKAIARWNTGLEADFDFFGHWHQHQVNWRWVCCGASVGFNEFAVRIRAAYQPPTQTIALMNKRTGRPIVLPMFVEPTAGYVRADPK